MDIPGDNDFITPPSPDFHEATVLAYVKPIATDRGRGYAVCASDGTQLAVFSSKDAAFFAARQHDLEPVLIH